MFGNLRSASSKYLMSLCSSQESQAGCRRESECSDYYESCHCIMDEEENYRRYEQHESCQASHKQSSDHSLPPDGKEMQIRICRPLPLYLSHSFDLGARIGHHVFRDLTEVFKNYCLLAKYNMDNNMSKFCSLHSQSHTFEQPFQAPPL